MGVFKNMVKKWLNIQEGNNTTITINEPYTYEGNLAKNLIWFRGDASELHQFYTQKEDSMGKTSFWAAEPTKGLSIRKIHTGLPSLIVKTLAKVVINNLDSIKIVENQKDEYGKSKLSEKQKIWDEIYKENEFKKLVKKAIIKALYLGDGAFKISFDTNISKYPIIEFYGSDRVEFKKIRGRYVEIIFSTRKVLKGKEYYLKDHYTKKGVTYTLEDSNGKEVDINNFKENKELEGLEEIVNPCEMMMAIPFMIEESAKWEDRGRSIFDGKEGAFDSFDEVWSQWIDAVRAGRMKQYIPETLIPRDPETGELMKPNSFDNRFIQTETSNKETDKNEIKTSQGEIPSEDLLSAYITALDLCLQGLISPSTLGIDSKKVDNAEAQREKEKTTLYSRDEIIDSLHGVLKEVVNTSLKAYDIAQMTINSQETIEMPEDYIVDIQFGEYANPSFEAQIETVGKASTTHTMSIQAQVEELWGDTKDDKWKKEEVLRIKEERGIAEMELPSVNQDLKNKNLEDLDE